MTQQTSKTLILAMTLATFSFLAIPSAAFAMGSINLELQKTAGADRLEEDARNARGEETFINLSALNMTELDVTETAAFKGSIYPNPGQVNVDFNIVNPDGTHLESLVLQTNADGDFKYQFTAMDAGNYAITASWDGNESYLGTSAELELPVKETRGMFVILATGDTSSPSLHASRKRIGEHALTILLSKNIPMSRIQFLTPDYGTENAPIFATGLDTKENLVYAIEQWAPALVDTRNANGVSKTPLTLILAAPGATDYILLDSASDVITSDELAESLDNFTTNVQSRFANTANAPYATKVNAIIESPQSGSFIDELSAAPGRYIMTSAADAQILDGGASHLGSNGNISFTYQFMSQIGSNKTLSQAFSAASQTMTAYYNNQEPQLNANGSNSSMAFAGLYLETHATSNLAATILSVNATQAFDTLVTLTAMVTDPEGDNLNVSATIIPPAGSEVSTFVQALVQSGSGNTYSAEAAGLDAPGVYQVIYSAVDSNGNISNVKSSTITVE